MPDKQIEDLLTDDSFVRWMTGNTSAAETRRWENWVSEDDEHKKLVTQAEKLIRLTESSELAIPDPQVELRKFEASVHRYKQQSSRSEKIEISRNHHARNFYGPVAATLVILLVSIGFFLTFDTKNINNDSQKQQVKKREFQTAYGEKISLKLSDGSFIMLNANSSLKYTSSVQSGQNINVWLEGEAYFDIPHFKGDDQRVLTVHTSDGSVEVLGTEFVVKASPEGTRAVLEKGKIRIMVKNNSAGPDTGLVMKPNERAYFVSGSRKVELQTVNTAVYTSWVKDKWHFDNTPLTEVARRIEDTYGVEVDIRTSELKRRILSGSIKSTNLKILQEALSKILGEPVIQQADSTVIIGLKEQQRNR